MTYNPEIHHRRSIRLKGYDYSQAGAYFTTICCQNKICRFGKIVKIAGSSPTCVMVLNEYGLIAYEEWIKLPERFSNMDLDVFEIMPNHMHGIVLLQGFTGNASTMWARASPAPTIGDIVGAYKSLVTNSCLDIFKSKNKIMGKLWQRNYYEHIIRNEESYEQIAEYIVNNPLNWEKDDLYNH